MPIPAWTQFDDVDHGEYAAGNTGGDASGLRVLWTNAMHLAGDDTTGYRAGYSVATGYPLGSAVAVYRGPVMWTLEKKCKVKNLDHSVIYLQRRYDYLYYRGWNCELSYVGADDKDVTQKLDDCGAIWGHPNWRVVDLSQIPGLIYGMWYCVRADLTKGVSAAVAFAMECVR